MTTAKDSSTRGLLAQIFLTEFDRRIMNIPAGVWRADRNIGRRDVLLVNFPSAAFDHENPDKYRLAPLDTDLIPHSFGDTEVVSERHELPAFGGRGLRPDRCVNTVHLRECLRSLAAHLPERRPAR